MTTTTLASLTRTLNRAVRLQGDLRAARRGTLGQRLVRRQVRRGVLRLLSRGGL